MGCFSEPSLDGALVDFVFVLAPVPPGAFVLFALLPAEGAFVLLLPPPLDSPLGAFVDFVPDGALVLDFFPPFALSAPPSFALSDPPSFALSDPPSFALSDPFLPPLGALVLFVPDGALVLFVPLFVPDGALVLFVPADGALVLLDFAESPGSTGSFSSEEGAFVDFALELLSFLVRLGKLMPSIAFVSPLSWSKTFVETSSF